MGRVYFDGEVLLTTRVRTEAVYEIHQVVRLRSRDGDVRESSCVVSVLVSVSVSPHRSKVGPGFQVPKSVS